MWIGTCAHMPASAWGPCLSQKAGGDGQLCVCVCVRVENECPHLIYSLSKLKEKVGGVGSGLVCFPLLLHISRMLVTFCCVVVVVVRCSVCLLVFHYFFQPNLIFVDCKPMLASHYNSASISKSDCFLVSHSLLSGSVITMSFSLYRTHTLQKKKKKKSHPARWTCHSLITSITNDTTGWISPTLFPYMYT